MKDTLSYLAEREVDLRKDRRIEFARAPNELDGFGEQLVSHRIHPICISTGHVRRPCNGVSTCRRLAIMTWAMAAKFVQLWAGLCNVRRNQRACIANKSNFKLDAGVNASIVPRVIITAAVRPTLSTGRCTDNTGHKH